MNKKYSLGKLICGVLAATIISTVSASYFTYVNHSAITDGVYSAGIYLAKEKKARRKALGGKATFAENFLLLDIPGEKSESGEEKGTLLEKCKEEIKGLF